MPKKNIIRFAIGNKRNIFSEVWTLWVQKSDVYLTTDMMSSKAKISLHESGICHLAITQEYLTNNKNPPKELRDKRSLKRWVRGKTPSLGFQEAMSVHIASFEEWKNPITIPKDKKISILDVPCNTKCLKVGIFYTKNIEGLLECPYPVLKSFPLKNGEFVNIVYTYVPMSPSFFENKILTKGQRIIDFNCNLDDDFADKKSISIFQYHVENSALMLYSLHNMQLLKVRKSLITRMNIFFRRIRNYGF